MNSKAPLLYKISKIILGFIFKLYYNPKIVGKENIPKEGAIVVAGNHVHLYDQCLTILSTKRYLCYMAKKEYFDDKKVASDLDQVNIPDPVAAELQKLRDRISMLEKHLNLNNTKG